MNTNDGHLRRGGTNHILIARVDDELQKLDVELAPLLKKHQELVDRRKELVAQFGEGK